jgi:hypothetical protein
MDLEGREEDERRKLEERELLRQTMLETDRKLRETQVQRIEDITTRWRATQKVKRDRNKRDLQFEMATRTIEDLKALRSRQIHSADNQNGVVGFEKNLKRLGINGGEGSDTHMSISYEAHDAFEKRLQQLANDTRPPDEEIMGFNKELKERTAEKRAARYEKARRRRRALVEQDSNAPS